MKAGIVYCLACAATSLMLTWITGTVMASVGMVCGLAIGLAYGMYEPPKGEATP